MQIFYRIQLREWKHPFKNFTDFIGFLKHSLEEDPHGTMNSRIGVTWMSRDELKNDSKPLRLLAALKILDEDELFDEVFRRLMES